jgi:hypothetical protein
MDNVVTRRFFNESRGRSYKTFYDRNCNQIVISIGMIFEKRKHLNLIKHDMQTFSYLNQAQKKLVP